jgi:hypothetical protein
MRLNPELSTLQTDLCSACAGAENLRLLPSPSYPVVPWSKTAGLSCDLSRSRAALDRISLDRLKSHFSSMGLFCDIYNVQTGSIYASLRPWREELFGVVRVSTHPPRRPIYLPSRLQPKRIARTWPHVSLSLHDIPLEEATVIWHAEMWLATLWESPLRLKR